MKLGREAPQLLGRLNPLGPYAPRVPTFLASHPIHLHSTIYEEMVQYHNQYPDVDIDITPYCTNHNLKFQNTIVTKTPSFKSF